MATLTKLKSTGFTLVEVIITLVVSAIVGTMLVSVLGTSMTKSSEPIFRIQKSFALHQVMENFITAYEKYYAGDLPSLQESIEKNPDNKYGEYTIVENKFIKFVSSVEEDNTGDTKTQSLLKVTIKNGNNETLTYIFAS